MSETEAPGTETSPAVPKYSICITHFNNASTLKRSIESILGQIDKSYEVVVVDNVSSDGSLDFLKRLASEGRIRVEAITCSRGRGRQLALQLSTGQYVIGGVDLDVIYKPILRDVVDYYHSHCEGKLMKFGAVIGPRELLDRLGGWPDLQWGEDRYLLGRAQQEGVLVTSGMSIKSEAREFGRGRGNAYYLRYKFQMMRDTARVHGSILRKIREASSLNSRFALAVIGIAGLVGAQFMKKYPRVPGF